MKIQLVCKLTRGRRFDPHLTFFGPCGGALQVWTAGVCEEVADEVVQFFGNGSDSPAACKRGGPSKEALGGRKNWANTLVYIVV